MRQIERNSYVVIYRFLIVLCALNLISEEQHDVLMGDETASLLTKVCHYWGNK